MFKQALRVVLVAATLSALMAVASVQAQKGDWVDHQRKGGLASSAYKAVGEYCIAVTNPTDSVFSIYDLLAGEWHDYAYSSAQLWRYAPATDGHVALVWSSNVAIAYSNLTQTFVPLTYSGNELGYADGYGCRGNMAYFLTSDFLYVFDGEDGAWKSLAYTKPTADPSKINMYVGSGPEYMFFALSNSAGWVQQTYVGYSYTTKTFDEYPGENMEYALLANGFAFFCNKPLADSANHFIAAWSASIGITTPVSLADPRPITRSDYAWADEVSHTFAYVDISEVDHDGGINRCDVYGFDDRFSGFTTDYFDYNADCSDACPWFNAGGGEFAFVAVRVASAADAIDFHIYDGSTNSMTSLSSVLTYPIGTLNCHATSNVNQAGGRALMSWDCDNLMGYDLATRNSASVTLPALTAAAGEASFIDVNENWGVYLLQRGGSSTTHMYSYNGPNNNLTELTGTSTDAAIFYDTTNVVGIYTRNSGTAQYNMYLYSPTTDEWTTEDFLDIQPIIRMQRDFIWFYDYSLNTSHLVMFDGVTGQKTQFSFGWVSSTETNANSYYNSNFLILYSTGGKHIGYSTHTRTYSEYTGPIATSRYGTYDVVVMIPQSSTPNKQTITYNALYGNFVPHVLTSAQGTYSSPVLGKKTALMYTNTGWLLAFDPFKDTPTAVEDDPAGSDVLPNTFGVSQNYPNPFNPDTRIDFSLPERSDVKVEIFNTLGQRVRLLLNESRPAGDHTVYWDGRDGSGAPSASGVYFYRVTAGDHVGSRKMVMLK